MLPFQVISKDYVRSLFWGHSGEQKMVSELRETSRVENLLSYTKLYSVRKQRQEKSIQKGIRTMIQEYESFKEISPKGGRWTRHPELGIFKQAVGKAFWAKLIACAKALCLACRGQGSSSRVKKDKV